MSSQKTTKYSAVESNYNIKDIKWFAETEKKFPYTLKVLMLIKHGILNILKFRYFGRNPNLYKEIIGDIKINNNKFSYQNSSLC